MIALEPNEYTELNFITYETLEEKLQALLNGETLYIKKFEKREGEGHQKTGCHTRKDLRNNNFHKRLNRAAAEVECRFIEARIHLAELRQNV